MPIYQCRTVIKRCKTGKAGLITHHLHESLDSITEPSIVPVTIPMAPNNWRSPLNFPRSLNLTMSVVMMPHMTSMPPAPMPCNYNHKVTIVSSCFRQHGYSTENQVSNAYCSCTNHPNRILREPSQHTCPSKDKKCQHDEQLVAERVGEAGIDRLKDSLT